MKTKLLLLVALLFTIFSVNAQVTSVAIVGAAAGGWPANTPGEVDVNQMTQVTPGGDVWTITMNLVAGGCKFRSNNSWNNGAAPGEWAGPFPTNAGTAITGGGDINVPIAQEYTITLNVVTGVYNFSGGVPVASVKLIGPAVTPATGVAMTTTDGSTYKVNNVLLTASTVQFEANDNATTPTISIYGGTEFILTAGTTNYTGNITGATDNIPVLAGTYNVTVDTANGSYTFEKLPDVIDIALIGGGTPIGWPDYTPASLEDTQKMVNDNDGNENYYLAEIPLTTPVAGNGGSGKVKFRANKSWAVQWSGAGWPTGTGDNAVGDIFPNPAGTYSVDFVRSTKEYSFFLTKVGLIGAGVAGWDGTNEKDMTSTDQITYTIDNVVCAGGPMKFRMDKRWKKSWGATGTVFPSGTGSTTCSGCDITIPAGTYNVTFNRLTGEYSFTDSNLASRNFSMKSFKVSQNPTSTSWIIAANNEISSVIVTDMLGKVVANMNTASNEVSVDASGLNKGVYFAKVSSANATETVKLVRN